ncbi:MAG: DUF2330 domain-containing protein [Sandaracinaceae bacterium]
MRLTPAYPALALVAGLALAPSDAAACGGFFCNSAQPVNQAAERIVFARGADGSVTAVIQIQYRGPSERFAWMLPVNGSPTIGVSSNLAFQRLQSATNPQYILNTTVEGSCRESDFFASPQAGGASDASAPAADAGAGSVTVLDRGSVGPYDYVILEVDPAASDVTQAAVDWLHAESFDVPETGADRIRDYLESGMNLLAFRLTKGNDAGSIRPVTIGFGSGLPSIPIRPTALAATDDMGVMVWVLGEHRAVPVNYLSLELNDALINWLNPSSNYNDVVTRAANEAGGQGFVTEMAGAAGPLAQTIYPTWEADSWAYLSTTDWSADHGGLLQQALGTFGQHDGMRDVLASTVPLPAGVSRDDFLSCPFCYASFSEAHIDGFDPAAFLAAMRTQVIEPHEATSRLFWQSPYVTRLYTTMSAWEMTLDPIFDENASLPAVSTIHTADRVIECSPSIDRFDAPWRITLPNGSVVRGAGNTWPFSITGEVPAVSVSRRVGSDGVGRIVTDNRPAIEQAIRTQNATVPVVRHAGGCSVSRATAPGLPGFALVGIALGWVLRRRRGVA